MGWYHKMGNKCWNKVISTMTKYRVNLLLLAKHGVTFLFTPGMGMSCSAFTLTKNTGLHLPVTRNSFILTMWLQNWWPAKWKKSMKLISQWMKLWRKCCLQFHSLMKVPWEMIVSHHPVWIKPKTCLMTGGKGRGRDQFLATPQKGNPNPYISVENAPLFANNRVLYCSRVAVQAENVISGIISHALITMILRKPAGCVKNAVTIYESYKIVATLSAFTINVKFKLVKNNSLLSLQ